MSELDERAQVFLAAAAQTFAVEIFVRTGPVDYEQQLRSAPELVRDLAGAVAHARQAIEVVQQVHEQQLLRFAAKRAKDERKIARLKAEVAELHDKAAPGVSTFPMRIEQFATWLANGERGLSSEAIVTQLTGVRAARYGSGWDHPHDAGDWRRCERLLRAVPEARVHLNVMNADPAWAALVEAWDELVELARTAPDFFESARCWRIPALDRRIAALLENPS